MLCIVKRWGFEWNWHGARGSLVGLLYYTGCQPVYPTHALAFGLASILGQPPGYFS